jgi:hypothetical protein
MRSTKIMAAKLTRLTHKIAIQLHLVAESCTICSSFSRRPVRKLLDTRSYIRKNLIYTGHLVLLVKSRMLWLVGHVARVGETKNAKAYRILAGKSIAKRPLGRPTRRWEDNIKTDRREIYCEDGRWMEMAQNCVQSQTVVFAVLNLRVLLTQCKSKVVLVLN